MSTILEGNLTDGHEMTWFLSHNIGNKSDADVCNLCDERQRIRSKIEKHLSRMSSWIHQIEVSTLELVNIILYILLNIILNISDIWTNFKVHKIQRCAESTSKILLLFFDAPTHHVALRCARHTQSSWCFTFVFTNTWCLILNTRAIGRKQSLTPAGDLSVPVRSHHFTHDEQLKCSLALFVNPDRTTEPWSRSATGLSSLLRMCSTRQCAASSMFEFSWWTDKKTSTFQWVLTCQLSLATTASLTCTLVCNSLGRLSVRKQKATSHQTADIPLFVALQLSAPQPFF